MDTATSVLLLLLLAAIGVGALLLSKKADKGERSLCGAQDALCTLVMSAMQISDAVDAAPLPDALLGTRWMCTDCAALPGQVLELHLVDRKRSHVRGTAVVSRVEGARQDPRAQQRSSMRLRAASLEGRAMVVIYDSSGGVFATFASAAADARVMTGFLFTRLHLLGSIPAQVTFNLV